MWTLILWFDQKIKAIYMHYKHAQKRKQEMKQALECEAMADSLPEYLRRDMGLPPYGGGMSEDKKS